MTANVAAEHSRGGGRQQGDCSMQGSSGCYPFPCKDRCRVVIDSGDTGCNASLQLQQLRASHGACLQNLGTGLPGHLVVWRGRCCLEILLGL